jgi:hypothetical protein
LSLEMPPRGAESSFTSGTCPKSFNQDDGETAGNRVADSLSGRPLALPCLSGRAPPYPFAQALHECPSAPPNPSPLRHLGARDRDQNFTERLPAGTAADEISSGQHTARSTQKAQASSGPPMRSSWSSFCLCENSIGTEKKQAEGERGHVSGGASRATASNKERTAPVR